MVSVFLTLLHCSRRDYLKFSLLQCTITDWNGLFTKTAMANTLASIWTDHVLFVIVHKGKWVWDRSWCNQLWQRHQEGEAGSCWLACFQSLPNSFDISAWCFGESEHDIHTCNSTYLQSQKERIIGVPFLGFGDLLNLSFALKSQIYIYIKYSVQNSTI